MLFNPLNYPVCFEKPRRLTDIDSWHEHIPFAFAIVQMLKPKIIVELGTHKGDSYCAFCQAVDVLGLDTECYAIDTWKGDGQAGFYGDEVLKELRAYHDPLYGRFSRLIQSRFDQALDYFSDGSIDLLHIDGLHTYEAVKHDFDNWLPKMSVHGVILLHDTNVREREFGVWRLCEELKNKYSIFKFNYGHGLGIISVGAGVPEELSTFLKTAEEDIEVSKFFYHLGSEIKLSNAPEAMETRIIELTKALQSRDEQIFELNKTVQNSDAQIKELKHTLQEINQSITWQMVMKYHRMTEMLLPYGTRRHKYYYLMLNKFRALFNNFFKKKLLSSTLINQPQIVFKVKDNVCSLPDTLLSIVIMEDAFNINILNLLYKSINHQTLNSLEIISYSEKAKRITIWKQREFASRVSRECGSKEMMTTMLTGLYVYVPTEHFVLFPETFLESNVLALVSENLLFTINFFGIPREILFLQTSKDDLQDVLFVCKDLATFEDMRLSTFKFKNSMENTIDKVVGLSIIQPKIETSMFNNNINLPDAFGIDDIEFISVNRHIIPKRPEEVVPSSIEHNFILNFDQIFQEKAINTQKSAIMVFMPFLAIGGAEKLTKEILLRIKDQFEIVIVTVESPDPSLGEQSHMFRKVTPLIYHLAQFSIPDLFLSNMSYLIRKYSIKTLFVANGANWFYDKVNNIKAIFPNLRIINQVYDHKHGWINRITPNIFEAIDMHIAVNKSIENAYKEKGIPSKKICLIHHGIDLSQFDFSKYNADSINISKQKFALPEDRLIVSFIARFHPQKRPIDFLILAKRMEHDKRFFFLMVGDGPLSSEVNRYVEIHKLSNTKRLPFYEPIADILSLTDILVITSEYEGLPLVLLEAQAMAVPVISTNVGCIDEVITTGENGILIGKIGDIKAFEQGVLTLANIKDRRTWGLKGRERVTSDFNIEKVAREYRDVLGDN
ncbi:MAG: glycosyltransferase [Candidatus Methanoperedens sp.]|nr:glycosyltransferase [Candidatus Methanoperedens sp.]